MLLGGIDDPMPPIEDHRLGASAANIAQVFQDFAVPYTGGKYLNQEFKYRLFVPTAPTPGQKYPLLVWLHGAGESGDDNWRQLYYMDHIITEPENLDHHPFFVLVAQCPEDDPSWFHRNDGKLDPASEDGGEMLCILSQLVDRTLRDNPVDSDRVYLAGVSSGAEGCWEFAMRRPELFAAVAPMSAFGPDVSRAERLKKLPIWAFHNIEDQRASPEGVQRMVEAVNDAGGDACLTIVPNDGWRHDSWSRAFNQYKIVDWMLAQRKTDTFRLAPPGCRPWHWTTSLAVPVGMAAIFWGAWVTEKRRRRGIVQASKATK
jgi:predicted peptidase